MRDVVQVSVSSSAGYIKTRFNMVTVGCFSDSAIEVLHRNRRNGSKDYDGCCHCQSNEGVKRGNGNNCIKIWERLLPAK